MKDEKGREVLSRFVIPDDGYTTRKADPITEEDLAELKRMKELMDQAGKK